MNYFEDALTRRLSTVLHGPFGRRPGLVRFYLDAIPDLDRETSEDDDEWVFWHAGASRRWTVVWEPPFDARLSSNRWCLVLASHLRLRYDPAAFRRVDARGDATPFSAPASTVDPDWSRVRPPIASFGPWMPERRPVHFDLSGVDDAHEAYLRLLTMRDALTPDGPWALSISAGLRRKLSEQIARGDRDGFWERVLQDDGARLTGARATERTFCVC